MIDVSIILVSYNTCQLTIDAINSVYLFTNKINFEIILVDNDSKDNTINEVTLNFPKVKIIKNNQNIGFGRANNKGIEVAQGKYLFLLNTDTYLVNNAIEILYHFMENPSNKDAAVVGATLLTPNGDWNVSFGYFPNFQAFIKGSFWRHFYPRKFYENAKFVPIKEDKEKPFLVDYVSGADFFVRAEVIKKVGGFEKSFFLYFEETELTLRIKRMIKNAKVYIIPEAKIVHISQGSSTVKNRSLRFQLRYLKSKALYYKFQNGYIASLLVYSRGLITILFNR